jgi:hypothetical protein
MSKHIGWVGRQWAAMGFGIVAGAMMLLGNPGEAAAQKEKTPKDETQHIELRCVIASGSVSTYCLEEGQVYAFDVPVGKRFVIEYVEVGGTVQNPSPVKASIHTTPLNSNVTGYRYFDVWASVIPSQSTLQPVYGSKTGRWYVDGGTKVVFSVGRIDTFAPAQLVVKVYGYLTAE